MKLFRLEFRNTRKSYISWMLSLSVTVFFLLAFFPSLQTEAMQALSKAKLESMPPAVLAIFGMESIPDFTVITNFFGMVIQYVTLAFSIFVAQSAVSMLLREETDGSIEYLYAQPVSRTEIFVFKMLANVLQLMGMVTVLFVQLIFMSIGVLLSALLRKAKVGVSAALAIIFGSFILSMLSTISENLEFLKYASPLDWIKFPRLLNEGLDPPMIILGIVLIIGCNTAALLRYKRKDFL